jgi:hypothetical protein
MHRMFICWFLISTVGLGGVRAKEDAPRGFQPISELEQAKATAIEKNQLLVVAIKGADDNCPHCAAAMESGERAVGSGVVKVFARAEALNKADISKFPSAFQERAKKKFTTGAWVVYLVFNPDGTKLLAESNRKELDGNSKAISAFKKKVSEEKKARK